MFRTKFFTIVALSAAFFVLPCFGQSAGTEAFGNSQVVEMHKLGLPDAAVIAKIKATSGKFDTSLSALKVLKAAGISGEIITAMIESQYKPAAAQSPMAGLPPAYQPDPNDPMLQYEPGIYMKGLDSKLLKMDTGKLTVQGSSAAQRFIPLAGFAAKNKWYLNEVEPVTTGSHRPEFTFYFAQRVGSYNRFAQLPLDNMVVVKMERDGTRLLLTQRAFGNHTGNLVRMKLEKTYKSIVIKATPVEDLPDGDYAIGNFDFDGDGSVSTAKLAAGGLYPFIVKGGVVK